MRDRDHSAVRDACTWIVEHVVANRATLLIILSCKNNNKVSRDCGGPNNHLEEISVLRDNMPGQAARCSAEHSDDTKTAAMRARFAHTSSTSRAITDFL